MTHEKMSFDALVLARIRLALERRILEAERTLSSLKSEWDLVNAKLMATPDGGAAAVAALEEEFKTKTVIE